MNLIYNKNKEGKIDFLSTIKRSYCALSPVPSAGDWAVKVDEEQYIVTFLVPPFFPQVFFHVSKFKS